MPTDAEFKSILTAYCSFLANQMVIRIPSIVTGNQGAQALLHTDNPLWNYLKLGAPTLMAKQALTESPEFKTLYVEYSADRPQTNYDNYVENTLLEFALKLLRRGPALAARNYVLPLVTDFMKFMSLK
jgi:hypothetical protein